MDRGSPYGPVVPYPPVVPGTDGGVRLREVEPGDVDLYVRLRCDPAMMAGAGRPAAPRASRRSVTGSSA